MPFMKQMYNDIANQLPAEFELPSEKLYSHLLFLRLIEIYQSIVVSLENSLPIPGAMQLRPLSESYILLKSSIESDDFYNRYMKHSIVEKKKWLGKIVKDLDKSAFLHGKEFFDGLVVKLEDYQSDLKSCLQQIPDLFRDHEELDMYLQIYRTSTLYLHINLQTLTSYLGDDFDYIAEHERDYTSQYIHTAYSAIYVLLRANSCHLKALGIEDRHYDELFQRYNSHASTIREIINK